MYRLLNILIKSKNIYIQLYKTITLGYEQYTKKYIFCIVQNIIYLMVNTDNNNF